MAKAVVSLASQEVRIVVFQKVILQVKADSRDREVRVVAFQAVSPAAVKAVARTAVLLAVFLIAEVSPVDSKTEVASQADFLADKMAVFQGKMFTCYQYLIKIYTIYSGQGGGSFPNGFPNGQNGQNGGFPGGFPGGQQGGQSGFPG